MVATLPGVKVEVIDKHKSYIDKKCNFIYKNINTSVEYDENKHNLYCFIGIDSLKQFVEYNKITSDNFMEGLANKGNVSIILLDNVQQIKSVEFDSWYKRYVINSDGLWIGSGIAEQFVLKYNQASNRLDNNCDINFGYVIKNGNARFVKLLEMSVEDE